MQTQNSGAGGKVGKILDYWSVLEFLGQDSYEVCTGASDKKRKLLSYKNSLKRERKKPERERKQLSVFLDLEKGQDLYECIRKECQECRMGMWGSLTFYLGKVRREDCVELIARNLKLDIEDRPEKSYGDIAAVSFQTDARGRYIRRSFSLSPVLWAVWKLQNVSEGQLSRYLSLEEYQADVENLAEVFWNLENSLEDLQEEELTAEKKKTVMPEFSAEALTMNKLTQIYETVRQKYLSSFIKDGNSREEAVKESYGVSFQLYQDIEARIRYGEENYLGLSHDYFSADLKMLKSLEENGGFDGSWEMCEDLLRYILAPDEEFAERECLDLLNCEEHEKLELWFQEVLNIRNAPLGKWPSRYQPAFMQQVAVNLVSAENRSGVFGKVGNIFSVNGPPGTGKTTLLKEIVANHIVEKAKKLCVYEDPDDAFEKHSFQYGDKADGRYSKYISGWYSLIDDSINDYGILVTSCNNTAVENITKELPIESGITGSLKASEKDSPPVREGLERTESLFAASRVQKKEELFRGKQGRNRVCGEVYFTGYAQELLRTEDAWGLVAAPLGKKENIKAFYYNVLNPMRRDFYPDGGFKEKRGDAYAKAREQFQEQLQKVERMREMLAGLGDAALNAEKAEQEYREAKRDQEEQETAGVKRMRELEEKEKALLAEIERLSLESREAERGCREEQTAADSWREKCDIHGQAVIRAQEAALKAAGSVSVFTKLFQKKKYQDAENLADSYRSQAKEEERRKEEAQKELKQAEERLSAAETEWNRIRNILEDREQERQAVEAERERFLQLKQELEEKTERSWKTAAEARAFCDKKMKAFSSGEEPHRGKILDARFVKDFLSKEEKASTQAQLVNPWTTAAYDREREKLVYEALQLTREFILNSKSCRDNFTTLGQYWGLALGDDKERIWFRKEDRERMAGALYQTLFLLVPVISSTFASVGSLLRDIKKPGVIGTLIVDEAGQAQPQMAVGALYRSKRAVIVGDPKQIEPVVTDDLELLKKAYSEDIYRCYQDKSLSVQKCADLLNPVGTFLQNGTDFPEWVGCPLLVHRRCISPMYEISNQISYGGIMKQQAAPPNEEKQKSFVYPKSQWFQISGDENGKKDHFVKEQGEKVCEILEEAFCKDENPKLYIISPFKSVIHGMRSAVREYSRQNRDSSLNRSSRLEDWLSENLGTVHTFQGKEANEVIFLLGCDGSRAAEGAVRWVNSNLVNVAVTRAKYRLYVIGDIRVWKNNQYVSEMKAVMDTFALKQMELLRKSDLSPEEKEKGFREAAEQLPGAASFPVEEQTGEDGSHEYSTDTSEFLSSLEKMGFSKPEVTPEQLAKFGFRDRESLEKLPLDLQNNLIYGIWLYFQMQPVYKKNPELDASCCAVMFGKALELRLRQSFVPGLKKQFPKFQLHGRGKQRQVPLEKASDREFMIGTIAYVLGSNISKVSRLLQDAGETQYTPGWWELFLEKLSQCADKRNQCCHAGLFLWSDLAELLSLEFQRAAQEKLEGTVEGVFFESAAGEKLFQLQVEDGQL